MVLGTAAPGLEVPVPRQSVSAHQHPVSLSWQDAGLRCSWKSCSHPSAASHWEGCSQWRLDVTLAWCFSPGLTSCVITAIHQLFMAGKSCGELGHDPLGIKLICCNVITKLIHCLVWATAHHFHVFLGRESNTECFWEQKGQRQIIFHTFPKEACGACCPNNESRA